MSETAYALWASIVRTVVPALVGLVLGLIARWNLPLDPEFEDALTALLTGVFTAAYYVAVRLLETYVTPKLGWLLGLAREPEYTPPKEPYGDGEGLLD